MSLQPYNLPFYNASGETVPPFAVMQVDFWQVANNREYFRVRKPNGSGRQYIINGPYEIPYNGDGMGSRSPGVQASYNNAATPAVDQEWGPVSGSWLLTSGGSGYVITGDLETVGSVSVVRVSETGAASGNVIYAQVNEASGVASGDPTFDFDNAIALVGTAPTGGTGTGQNQYAQTYADNEWVILSQRKDNQQWITERGGTAGSLVIPFELTQDMAYADTAKLAKPVNDDGTLNSGATAFYVVDMRAVATSGAYGQHYGKAAYTDADTAAVVWHGYRGDAVKFTDNWNATGVPGYRIVSMENPVDFFIGTCAESLSGSPAAAKVTYDATLNPAGSPFSARRPALLADSRVTCYDTLGWLPASGEKWILKWDRANARYVYWQRAAHAIIKAKVNEGSGVAATATTFAFDTGKNLDDSTAATTSGTADNIFGYCAIDNEDILLLRDSGKWVFIKVKRYVRVQCVAGSSVAASTASFTAGTVKALQGDLPPLSSGNITVYNAAKIVIANSAVFEARWNEETDHWETEPLVAHVVLGKATAAVTGGTFTIDNIELVSGSDPRSDPTSTTETLSITNPFAMNIDDNGDVEAKKKASGTWYASQADCPA